jgi:hypothetical protein
MEILIIAQGWHSPANNNPIKSLAIFLTTHTSETIKKGKVEVRRKQLHSKVEVHSNTEFNSGDNKKSSTCISLKKLEEGVQW